MQGPRTALSRYIRRPHAGDDARPTPAQRVHIHAENGVTWELVGGGPSWLVVRSSTAGEETFTLEDFEQSKEGERLANSLTVALARTPGV